MKAGVFVEPGRVEVNNEVPIPKVEGENEAVIRVLRACVCGSDLWWFRGVNPRPHGSFTGHEAIGVVEEVGSAVTTVKKGDFVIASFTHGCGWCAACQAGFDGNCLNAPQEMNAGYQAEYVRFKNAGWALIKVPGEASDYTDADLNSFLTLADVMATGYHAAASAEVKEGDTVVVMGDGAVGLCGVIAARMRGAKRIIAMSRHVDRQELALEFGATDIVAERGDEAVAKVMAMTHGSGADAALECVGTQLSLDTAAKVCRPGVIVGRVGVPHGEDVDTSILFWKNVGLRGGVAPVTTYVRNILLPAVLNGTIHPGKVFTKRFTLDQIQEAYNAMDRREAIKSLLVIHDA